MDIALQMAILGMFGQGQSLLQVVQSLAVLASLSMSAAEEPEG
ncbi:MAG TPA: hypothetical protein VGR06_22305 [Actinophytocola sp.]|nr:hypothetical protein [Actinophytocola sp.]